MPFNRFAFVMAPVLRQKAAELRCTGRVHEALEALWGPFEAQAAGGDGPPLPEESFPQTALNAATPGAVAAESWLSSAASSALSSAGSVSGSERSMGRRGTFSGALQAMGFRPLLSMVLSKTPDDLPQIRALVVEVLNRIQEWNMSLCQVELGAGQEAVSTLNAVVAAAGGQDCETLRRGLPPSARTWASSTKRGR